MSNPPGLGPHCVGLRVVVRRVLPGQTGPSGGPAMTDLLGVMESWDATSTTVRSEDGTTTEIALTDIVSGNPCRRGPRHGCGSAPSRRAGCPTPPGPPCTRSTLGDWLLRASGGFSARANSVMAIGDPGVPFDEAVATTLAFYREHRLTPWAQVVVGSETAARFEGTGWTLARPGEADSELQIASVAQAARAVRRLLPAAPPSVAVRTTVTPAWLANDERALAHHDDAVAVLEGPEQVGFAEIGAARPCPGGVAAGEGPGGMSRGLGRGSPTCGSRPSSDAAASASWSSTRCWTGPLSVVPPPRTCRFAQTTHLGSRFTPHWGFGPTTPTATSRRRTTTDSDGD